MKHAGKMPALPVPFSLELAAGNFHAVGVFDPTHCAAVIPCFNEAASIADLVSRVRRQLPHVVVVDDGSADGTGLLAAAAGAVVVRHERNCGKGAALSAGLARALADGFSWAVTLDGDGQHAPEDLPVLFGCAERTGAALVIGNRMQAARQMPWVRRFVNLWLSRQLSQRAGQPLPDTQSGFRVVHLPTWAVLSPHANRFEIESEVLMAFLAAGERVEFAPVRVIGSPRKSHIRPLADSVRWLRWWRRLDRPAMAGGRAGRPVRAVAG